MRASLVAVAVVALVMSGCGVRAAAARQKRANELKQIGLAYHNFMDSNRGAAPQKAADLGQYLDSPSASSALTDGSLTFIYGVSLADINKSGQGASNVVIAHEPPAGGSDLMVIMADGSVRTVTAQTFPSLTLAQPKAKDDANK